KAFWWPFRPESRESARSRRHTTTRNCVLLCLFAGGDLVHQLIAQKECMDWQHTRNMAIVATSFHGNINNSFWLRAPERRFPGKSAGMVFRKLLLDQSFASPLATSVFYTGDLISSSGKFSNNFLVPLRLQISSPNFLNSKVRTRRGIRTGVRWLTLRRMKFVVDRKSSP
uniref:Uncharacterized protein n=1 Tax=Monopterus albus TaxID=43700 RepID=A0A3Q3R9T8_MONAL